MIKNPDKSFLLNLPSPLHKVNHALFDKYQMNVYIKRDDLIHPIIAGNKWRKLSGNIRAAKAQGYEGILSFGGAYSNHIHALAFAGKVMNIKTLGVIRGETHYRHNSTLSDAQRWAMQLHFVDRKTYRLRHQDEYLTQLQQAYPNYFIVPEGGSNPLALSGVGEVINELNQQVDYDYLLTPVGSGGTLAGLIKADKNQHQILGVAVLKQAEYLQNEIKQLLAESTVPYDNWQLLTEFHLGGYGKFSQADAENIEQLNRLFKITFEPVYSGKMLLAFMQQLEQGYFKPNSTLVLLHTGGLQGVRGLIEQGKLNANAWHLPFVE